ncbi:hypothetical protein GC197_14610 [bacterium]|nr:hypothetical protein [bacterium]
MLSGPFLSAPLLDAFAPAQSIVAGHAAQTMAAKLASSQFDANATMSVGSTNGLALGASMAQGCFVEIASTTQQASPVTMPITNSSPSLTAGRASSWTSIHSVRFDNQIVASIGFGQQIVTATEPTWVIDIAPQADWLRLKRIQFSQSKLARAEMMTIIPEAIQQAPSATLETAAANDLIQEAEAGLPVQVEAIVAVCGARVERVLE